MVCGKRLPRTTYHVPPPSYHVPHTLTTSPTTSNEITFWCEVLSPGFLLPRTTSPYHFPIPHTTSPHHKTADGSDGEEDIDQDMDDDSDDFMGLYDAYGAYGA